jgi:hypothetical protein
MCGQTSGGVRWTLHWRAAATGRDMASCRLRCCSTPTSCRPPARRRRRRKETTQNLYRSGGEIRVLPALCTTALPLPGPIAPSSSFRWHASPCSTASTLTLSSSFSFSFFSSYFCSSYCSSSSTIIRDSPAASHQYPPARRRAGPDLRPSAPAAAADVQRRLRRRRRVRGRSRRAPSGRDVGAEPARRRSRRGSSNGRGRSRSACLLLPVSRRSGRPCQTAHQKPIGRLLRQRPRRAGQGAAEHVALGTG